MAIIFFSHSFSVSVGLALIGGLLAWINRKGGCTSRSKPKRPADFEDFGLAETDFPHHRSPPMAAANVAPGMAAAGAAGAAGAAAAMASPTIPRLNEQGNYYDPSTAEYGTNRIYYEPQLTGPPQPDYQYPPHHQQQQYYYPQEGGYYDEHGYYYENGSTAVSSPGQQQAMYDSVAAGGNSDYYKPDSADGASAAAKPNQRM